MAAFTVTPEALEAQASRVEAQNTQYRQIITRIYQEKESMQSTWKGEANLAYCRQLDGFRNDFENLANLLSNYVEYIRSSAKKYKETDRRLSQDAKQKLTVGK